LARTSRLGHHPGAIQGQLVPGLGGAGHAIVQAASRRSLGQETVNPEAVALQEEDPDEVVGEEGLEAVHRPIQELFPVQGVGGVRDGPVDPQVVEGLGPVGSFGQRLGAGQAQAPLYARQMRPPPVGSARPSADSAQRPTSPVRSPAPFFSFEETSCQSWTKMRKGSAAVLRETAAAPMDPPTQTLGARPPTAERPWSWNSPSSSRPGNNGEAGRPTRSPGLGREDESTRGDRL